jgi:prophage regulatory protein
MSGERLLDLKGITAKTTLSRSKIYAMLNEGLFPPPLRLGPQTVRWRESTIDSWIANLQPATQDTHQ